MRKRLCFIAFSLLVIGIPCFITVACFVVVYESHQSLLSLAGAFGGLITLFSIFAVIRIWKAVLLILPDEEEAPMLGNQDDHPRNFLARMYNSWFTQQDRRKECAICLEDNERLHVTLIVREKTANVDESVRLFVASEPLVRCKTCSHMYHHRCAVMSAFATRDAGAWTCPCCRTPW